MHGILSGGLMIILFTSNNIASLNIAKKLIANHGFKKSVDKDNEWTKGEMKLIDTKAATVLDVPIDFETDYILVLSTHKSKINEKVMTAHFPGNWSDAEMGGNAKTLNIAAGSRLKILLQEIKKQADRIGWNTSLEADHHGPTGKVPIIFAEIGSGEEEWCDENAAEAMANAIMASFSSHETYETFFGVGGGHYPRAFTKLILEGELAVGHIAPKYVIDVMDEDMFKQAIEKNVENISKVLIVKEETNAVQKEKIKNFATKYGIKYELI